MMWIDYKRPKEINEALKLLMEAEGNGRVIAGGTDLLLQLKRGEHKAQILIDITGIDELKRIEEDGSWIRIGAGVTHSEVARSPLIQREANALSEGSARVGSPQIRNMGTLVGNVISAQPAGDGAIPLFALEAELCVISSDRERWIRIEEAYRGVGLSAIDPTKEIVKEIRFKKSGKDCRSKFFRMERRKALSLPILNGAVVIHFDRLKNRIRKVRIALGPVAEVPFRPLGAEFYLETNGLNPETIVEASRIASDESNPRDSVRGSALYRKEMVRVQLIRIIEGILGDLQR